MEELRKSPRVRALKGARIVYNNGTSTRDCVIRNMSSGGAKIIVETTMGLPDDFILNFDDGEQHACHVRWRKLAKIGVEFYDAAEPEPANCD